MSKANRVELTDTFAESADLRTVNLLRHDNTKEITRGIVRRDRLRGERMDGEREKERDGR